MQTAVAARTTCRIRTAGIILEADFWLPERALGVVLVAHGSGSSRRSPRNHVVARLLVESGFAVLLPDLLTHGEEARDVRTREFRFDIARLAERVVGATDWLTTRAETRGLPVGFLGASTGAAAALIAAVERAPAVHAVVSRGGRPDLAVEKLSFVTAPTLFIVGGNDLEVLRLNELALARMRCVKRLELVPGATHLFPEPGALEEVSRLALEWFHGFLGRRRTPE